MKIYIVTSGCYSDYGIDKVFTDEEKANRYCRVKNKGKEDKDGYGYRVEEYDTEETEPEYKKVTYCKYDIWREHGGELVEFRHYEEEKPNEITKGVCNRFTAYLELVRIDNCDEQQMELKVRKVCEDLESQLKYLNYVEQIPLEDAYKRLNI